MPGTQAKSKSAPKSMAAAALPRRAASQPPSAGPTTMAA